MAATSRGARGIPAQPLLRSMLALLLCVLALLTTGAIAADPAVAITRFKNMPTKLFHFDDSTVVLMHDSLSFTLYRSDDEGKSWNAVADVGEVERLIEHPHEKSTAFLISSGKKHYVTSDKGKTWKHFETPLEASTNVLPLAFHATKPDWIIYQGTKCEKTAHTPWGKGRTCWDEAYYTTSGFREETNKMLSMVSTCSFARSQKVVDTPENMVFCIAFDTKPSDNHKLTDARLYRSDNWFKDREFVDLGIGKRAVGIVGLGVVSKFMVVAVQSTNEKRADDPMMMFVSTNGVDWRQTQFPHSAIPGLKENAYTIVESTTNSIAVDVLTSPSALIGTLFVSSAEGTYFVESLQDTNRNENGIVDYEGLVGLEGIGIANVVRNRERVVSGGDRKQLSSRITFDDGSNWAYLRAPKKKMDGSSWDCDPSDLNKCSLHVHAVTTPHNLGAVFSSTAPGFVMAVGSVGDHLLPYNDCDTFLSTDAGVTWQMVQEGAHKYEFGDQGSIIVIADDEDYTDHVHYSYDGGKEWTKLELGITCRVTVLTTIPDSTSQKFLIIGQVPRKDKKDGRIATVFLDFAPLQKSQCKESDFEQWYARGGEGQECIMGHKQWYKRRKLDAKCYVGNKFEDPVSNEEDCPCTDADFECDFNFVRQSGDCVPVGPEVVPPGTCKSKDDQYEGSSGYRKIPGNTCKGGKDKAAKVKKPCTDTRPHDGKVSHVVHNFDSKITFHAYFSNSQTILIQLADDTVWQSSNDGYSWAQPIADQKFLTIRMHPYDDARAYLIGNGDRYVHYTKDTGASWQKMKTPMDPNTLAIELLDFHPTRPDWLIWTGSAGCTDTISNNCHATSYYTTDHGSSWREVETYVKGCRWARDTDLKIDERMIMCESYKTKQGSQKSGDRNPVQYVAGRNYYSNKKVLFESIIGAATFSDYMLVAKLNDDKSTLSLMVSMDGVDYAEAQFPPGMRIDNHAYTILESNTKSVFLHMTMNNVAGREWGSIFKSNSNGTYYGLSAEHVNRDSRGLVDFEKMTGLDGIVVINIVANPNEVDVSGRKKIQSRITHNDGGQWRPLSAPETDSLGRKFDCSSVSCSLHIHGYTERRDPKATYSSPSAVGLMLAVGNVGEELAAYDESDIFLTRDGGFTWEEVHKDAHMWEFGDSGSILVLVNDEEAVDHVLYSTDEGKSWNSYSFGEKLRVSTIQTVPQDTSRRFFLIGQRPRENSKSVLVHLDFSAVQTRQCQLKLEDPNNDDFELWSPSENRDETCLFGRQSQYHRRVRNADCYVGEQIETLHKIVRNCTCTESDFECEFNHVRNSKNECVLVPGATALDVDTQWEQCTDDEEFWYERTAYRKIPYGSCVDGKRLDRGKKHTCPGLTRAGSLGALFWASIAILPFGLAGLAGWWWVTKGHRTGSIRLGDHRAYGGGPGGAALNTLASVPYFLLGVVSALWSAIERQVPFVQDLFRRRAPYRAVPIDDDAELLGEYEDD